MKRLFLILVSISLFLNCSVFAQKTNLSKLKEKERNEYLMKLSEEIISKNIIRDFNVEDYFVTIEKKQVPEGVIVQERGLRPGRIYYVITFLEDKDKPEEFKVIVHVWENTGKFKRADFPSGMSLFSKEND